MIKTIVGAYHWDLDKILKMSVGEFDINGLKYWYDFIDQSSKPAETNKK
jgi:hypothetical protein